MVGEVQSDKVRKLITALASDRAPSKSLCPSEVARCLSDDWRPLMETVRRVAAEMPDIIATQGGKIATQGGKEVDPITAKGPIRLRLRPNGDA